MSLTAVFFYGLTFGPAINTSHLLSEAIKQGVSFIPSDSFAATHKIKISDGMRLNFSHPDENMIEEGIKRLALSYKALNQKNTTKKSS